MVGSYSSTKWFWMSWMVSALLPTPPAPTTTSLYSVIFAAAAHRTHHCWREEREQRKVQISTYVHRALTSYCPTPGWPRCGPQPVAQTKHTVITIPAQWWETLEVCVVCWSVFRGGWGWDPQMGMWKMCWRYSAFQSSPTQCEHQSVCMKRRDREAVGEKRKGMTLADWPSSLRPHLSDFYLWIHGDRGES